MEQMKDNFEEKLGEAMAEEKRKIEAYKEYKTAMEEAIKEATNRTLRVGV